jgi:hypothetical protein
MKISQYWAIKKLTLKLYAEAEKIILSTLLPAIKYPTVEAYVT